MIVLTSDISEEAKHRALSAGARDFIEKPLEPVETSLRVRNQIEMRQLHLALRAQNENLEQRVHERTRELEIARAETLERLALAAEYRDDETREHTQRVGRAAALLAAELGLAPDEVELIGRAAPLHDIGKLGIPDEILLKPRKLSAHEFTLVKRHTVLGGQMLSGSTSTHLRTAEVIARSHHERWDGTGYPDGLAGDEIPLPGRIVALADVFDALTHRRPYKEAWALEEAVTEIRRLAGDHFDPTVVRAFEALDHESLLAPVGSAALEAGGPVSDEAPSGLIV